jgi:type II secretory ATPase GspE/PulE/Tfp pilus assembly ATPase PilB-like protein
VNQTQVNPKAGMTFATGLRALLRQDPNVIMVGEIRDGETADLAVQAALTGHVVLSTLHTNNAATCLPRLLEMGIEPFLIASTVNTVIGQRLVRRLCETCRIPFVPAGDELTALKKDFDIQTGLKHMDEYNDVNSKTPKLVVAEPVVEEEKEKETPKPKGKKVIEPEHDIETDKSILARIASDPNIINRSSAEAKKSAESAIASLAPAPTPLPVEPVKSDPAHLKPGEFMLYKAGPGCEACGGVSYQGRIGIYEVLEVDTAISKMIVGRATSDEIQDESIKAGMMTMQQDGFLKALLGRTTVEEVLRVTRE